VNSMNVLNNRSVADNKFNLLLEGYSVYAETEELIRLLKRRIESHNLNNIVIEKNDLGCWFIPNK